MPKFRIHWRSRSSKPTEVEGTDIANACNNAGIGGGAIRAVDYWEPIAEENAKRSAYAIFKTEGEFSDKEIELLTIALTPGEAENEVKRHADEFAEKSRSGVGQSTPIEILGSGSHMTVRIGKMGWGPRDVLFYMEEAPLASK